MNEFTYKILSQKVTSETSADIEYEITLSDDSILFSGVQGVLFTNPEYTVAKTIEVMAGAIYQRELNKRNNPVIQNLSAEIENLVNQEISL